LRLWLRVEASPSIGLGHLMRCVALAEEAVTHGISATFVTDGDAARATRLPSRGFAVLAPHPGWLGAVSADDLVVIDGYSLGRDVEAAARDRGATVARVADAGEGRHEVDLLIHPGPVSQPAYFVPNGSVLTGFEHVLIRREFRHHRAADRVEAGTLLLTFGGSDPAGVADAVIAALAPVRPPFRRLRLVIGPQAARPSRPPPWLESVVSPSNVAELLASGDAAVSAAGGTTWELLAMGVPTAVVQTADNQHHVYEGAVHSGAALAGGGLPLCRETIIEAIDELACPDVRRRLREAGPELVDGLGAERVLAALLQLRG
jgi:spore coat polysaccharide biosynthesis predicted glycosyltransferase SpsG